MQRRFHELVRSPWFSYLTILIIQLKVLWGIWPHRDLTSGDTSYYFVMAWSWFKSWNVFITWTPLYTAFYGTLMHLTPDAYIVTILSRIIIVISGTMLVLMVMRRLLPPGLAWSMTVWWALLPINFDSLYEVHQFTVIPILLTCIAVLWKPGPWGRGLGVAGLLTNPAHRIIATNPP